MNLLFALAPYKYTDLVSGLRHGRDKQPKPRLLRVLMLIKAFHSVAKAYIEVLQDTGKIFYCEHDVLDVCLSFRRPKMQQEEHSHVQNPFL